MAPTPTPPRLRTRRGLTFTALPALLVLAVVGAVLAFNHRDAVADERRREAAELASAAAENARGYIEDRFAVLAAIAASPTVRDRDVELRSYLLSAADAADLDSLSYVEAPGYARISTTLPAAGPRVDVRDREYVQRALAGGLAISGALNSRVLSVPVVAFAVPVPGAEAAIASSLRLDRVSRGLQRLLFLEGARATVVDGEGNLVVGPGGPLKEIEATPAGYPLAEMRARRGGVAEADGPDGERLLGYATLPRTGWLVVVDRPRSEVLGSLDRALYAELAALLVLLGIGVALTFATARRLDRLDERRDEALAEQRRIALVLQRSLLPDLIVPTGVAATAGYEPAQGETAVGGDWYDLVGTGDGKVAMSVGDVAGHGLAAAATMGKLRSATRSSALSITDPAKALAHLDRFAGLLDGRPLATVFYAVLDPTTGLLRYASAGHPPPVVLRADGTTELLEDGRSPLLGIGPDAPRRDQAEARLEPGDTLVLYTDGLVERPESSIDAGLAALVDLVRDIGPHPDRLAETLLASVPEPRRDDAAVLAVRLEPVAVRTAQPSSVAS